MLFDSERSGIKRDTKEGNLRHVTSPQLAHEERQKERDELDVSHGGGLDSATESTKMKG